MARWLSLWKLPRRGGAFETTQKHVDVCGQTWLRLLRSPKRALTTQTTAPSFVVPPPKVPSLTVVHREHQDDSQQSQLLFPVHRIYCVGRNYADHALEMGGDPDREHPFFFSKPASAIVPCGVCSETPTPTAPRRQPTMIPYPLATQNLHHEIELVIALGCGGVNIAEDKVWDKHIYGFAVGVDLTRRDLQAEAKRQSRPWDSAKAFDLSAPISNLVPDWTFTNDAKIWLTVNGEERQSGTLSQMTWTIPEIVSLLSQQFHLQSGDLIFTGTPAGVGPLHVGDHVRGGVEGLTQLEFHVGDREAS